MRYFGDADQLPGASIDESDTIYVLFARWHSDLLPQIIRAVVIKEPISRDRLSLK